MNLEMTLDLIRKIICVAIFFQAIELLRLTKLLSNKGAWSWEIIRKDFEFFPKPVLKIFDLLFFEYTFLLITFFQLFGSIVFFIFPQFSTALPLLFLTVLILLRWRGTFNGGSDYMTILVLMVLTTALYFKGNARIQTGCLWYLAIQSTLSYTMAGLVKIKHRNWRSGRALAGFLKASIYEPTQFFEKITANKSLMWAGSWIVMIFECSFSVIYVKHSWTPVFLGLAAGFHLANYYVLGLNRFFFAWLASYPAIYFTVQSRHFF